MRFFIKNPVLIFNSWHKVGDFLFASDDSYERLLERVERFSAFWLNQPEMSVLSMARYIVLFSSISNDVRYDNKSLDTRVVWDFPQQLHEISLMMHNLWEESRLAASKYASEDEEKEAVAPYSFAREKEIKTEKVIQDISKIVFDCGEENPNSLESEECEKSVSDDYDPVAKAAKEGLLDDFLKEEK